MDDRWSSPEPAAVGPSDTPDTAFSGTDAMVSGTLPIVLEALTGLEQRLARMEEAVGSGREADLRDLQEAWDSLAGRLSADSAELRLALDAVESRTDTMATRLSADGDELRQVLESLKAADERSGGGGEEIRAALAASEEQVAARLAAATMAVDTLGTELADRFDGVARQLADLFEAQSLRLDHVAAQLDGLTSMLARTGETSATQAGAALQAIAAHATAVDKKVEHLERHTESVGARVASVTAAAVQGLSDGSTAIEARLDAMAQALRSVNAHLEQGTHLQALVESLRDDLTPLFVTPPRPPSPKAIAAPVVAAVSQAVGVTQREVLARIDLLAGRLDAVISGQPVVAAVTVPPDAGETQGAASPAGLGSIFGPDDQVDVPGGPDRSRRPGSGSRRQAGRSGVRKPVDPAKPARADSTEPDQHPWWRDPT